MNKGKQQTAGRAESTRPPSQALGGQRACVRGELPAWLLQEEAGRRSLRSRAPRGSSFLTPGKGGTSDLLRRCVVFSAKLTKYICGRYLWPLHNSEEGSVVVGRGAVVPPVLSV